MSGTGQSLISQAVERLKQGDRPGGAALLRRELDEGDGAPDALAAVMQLGAHIGEADLAIDASRRLAERGSIEAVAGYWRMLSSHGRSSEALADIERQPPAVADQPVALYMRGTIATEWGRFDEARDLFLRALAKAPAMAEAWLALSVTKTFAPDDQDLAAMERLEPRLRDPQARATLCYALGKAREDCGDVDGAFRSYAAGAEVRRQQRGFDGARHARDAEEIIATYTAETMAKLTASGFKDVPPLFVMGLPRSGTTLTEQILRGHSQVLDGGEINLFGAAAIATRGLGFANALAYQQGSGHADPWGEIGRDYRRLLTMRFRTTGRVVDKSLGESRLVGLMLHSLPDARIAWLRRTPEDVALSCFRAPFVSGLEWTSSLTDIADYMRVEDRLFEHWRSLFPGRILAVPYEELVRSPEDWAERLQRHFGLPIEAGLEQVSRGERAIQTASVRQVRGAITTNRIGQSAAFESYLRPFRDRYYA